MSCCAMVWTLTTPSAALASDFYALLDRNKQAFDKATLEESDGQVSPRARDAGGKLLQRLRTKEVRNFPGYTEDDEVYIQRVVKLLEDGALPRPTLKKLTEAFRVESNPLRLLAIMRRDILPQFFQPVRADDLRHNFNPRQVILSEYLVKAQG